MSRSDPWRRFTVVAAPALIFALTGLTAATGPLRAQEPEPAGRAPHVVDPLRDALIANRHALRLGPDGELSGPGAERILEEARASRFLLVGEEHGIAEVPLLTAWLFEQLASDGYQHLAIEIGPTIADTLDRLAAGEDPGATIAAFFAAHPPGPPFFTALEDARLLTRAVAATGGAAGTLWGLDYDILADRYVLGRLRDLAPNAQARAAAEAAIRVADDHFRRAVQGRNPGEIMMFGGPDSVLVALRAAYDPAPDSPADVILETLIETLRINQHYVNGDGWTSNQQRALLNRRNLARRLRAEAATDESRKLPGVVFRFGGNHMQRGRTSAGVFDLGDMVQVLAEYEGSGSFHLMVIGGPEARVLRFDPTTFGWTVRPAAALGAPGMESLGSALLDGPTLFDLRPLRGAAAGGALGSVSHDFEHTIFAYDAVLVLVGSTPATPMQGAPWLGE